MTIGNLSNSGLANATALPELAEESLAIARQEQAREILADQSLKNLSEKLKNGTELVALDAPQASNDDGDFYSTMISALSRLAGLLGDMADSTIVELQFKRDEIKQLLKDKIATIEENETRRQEAIEARKEMEAHKKRAGVFGSFMNFVFAAAEIIGGAFVLAGGIISANPALIAGGASLMAAGALEVTAEIMTLTGGNEDTADKLRMAADGLLIAGIVLSSFGAASAAAPALAAAKRGAKEGVKEGAEKVVKETVEKAVKEGAEKLAKEAGETAAEKSSKRGLVYAARGGQTMVKGAAVAGAGNKSYEMYMTFKQHEYDVRQVELEAEIAELGAELEANVAKQEFINQLIQLLQEQWTRAVAGPIEEALKTLNGAIQDRGGVSKRIAASFSV